MDHSPLFLDGWVEFNRRKWGAQPLHWRHAAAKGGLAVEAMLYLDRRGQLLLPPLNPYLPVRLDAVGTSAASAQRHWPALTEPLLDKMRECGIGRTIALPPECLDVRPWQWAGFSVGVRYSCYLDFPHDPAHRTASLKGWLRRAERKGYRCIRAENLGDVHLCLLETRRRKGLNCDLSADDLALAQHLLGPEHFRPYVCYAPDGEPASACIELHRSGERALGLVKGTATSYLGTGASQALDAFILHDLATAGATGYDFVGANIPSIAAVKQEWGAEVRPYYTLEGYGWQYMISRLKAWRRLERSRKLALCQPPAPSLPGRFPPPTAGAPRRAREA